VHTDEELLWVGSARLPHSWGETAVESFGVAARALAEMLTRKGEILLGVDANVELDESWRCDAVGPQVAAESCADVERAGTFVEMMLRNGLVLQNTWGVGAVEWTHEAVGVHAGRRRQIDFVATRGVQMKVCRVHYDVDEKSDHQMVAFDSLGRRAEKMNFS
jgi:hypothetical protein